VVVPPLLWMNTTRFPVAPCQMHASPIALEQAMETYLLANFNCAEELSPSHELIVPGEISISSPLLESAKQVAMPLVVQLVGNFL